MTTCLKFRLPSGAAGMAAGITKAAIYNKLLALRNQNKIRPFKTKSVGYDYKVWLENEQDYIYFYLVWDSSNPWHSYTTIEEDYTPP